MVREAGGHSQLGLSEVVVHIDPNRSRVHSPTSGVSGSPAVDSRRSAGSLTPGSRHAAREVLSERRRSR